MYKLLEVLWKHNAYAVNYCFGKFEYFISTIGGRNGFVNFGTCSISMRLVALRAVGGCLHVRVL